MARKVLNYTVTSQDRDHGKTYQITEMPAAQAERWALRAFQALARAGVDIGDVAEGGMAALAQAGFRAFAALPFYEAEPLLAEMMTCVRFKPDKDRDVVVRDLVDDDMEEISTRLKVRAEVLKLHTDFFKADGPSTSGSTSTLSA